MHKIHTFKNPEILQHFMKNILIIKISLCDKGERGEGNSITKYPSAKCAGYL
jgi:hypothetical protein